MAITGTSGNDTLAGTTGDDTILGEAGNDSLDGDAGNDTLDGGTGADTLTGGDGNDRYIVDDAGDAVVDASGNDTIEASVSVHLGYGMQIPYSGWAPTFVETLILTGTADINGTGTDAAETIRGNAGANYLSGGGGVDILEGGAGNDTIDGGTGNDIMVGDEGVDTFYVDSALDNVAGTSGSTIYASVSYDLNRAWLDLMTGTRGPTAVGRLVLTGTADIDATGSGKLEGNSGANVLRGGDGNDLLRGFAGNDTLDGGQGSDSLLGDAGDDTYYVNSTSAGVHDSSGTDTIVSTVSFDLARGIYMLDYQTYQMMWWPAYVETLVLAGTGNLNGTGTGAAETLTGNAGANILTGHGGNDTLSGGAGSDTVHGGDGDDRILTGTASGESDWLTGGAGVDRYVLGTANAGTTTITDFAGGSGGDVFDIAALLAASSGYTSGNPFTASGGYLRLAPAGADLALQWDADASSTAHGWVTVAVLGGVGAGDLSGANFTDGAVPAAPAPTLAAEGITFIDTAGDDSFTAATGSLQGSDPAGSTLTYGVSGGTPSGDGLQVSVTGSFGTLTVDRASGDWNFAPNDAALEGVLADASETFTITADNGSTSVGATFTVDVTGADDASTPSGTVSGTVMEDLARTTGGMLQLADRDLPPAGFVVRSGVAGQYGVFNVAADGRWTYALDNAAAAVQALDDTTTLSDAFEVSTSDGATVSVSVLIRGTVEAPVLAGNSRANIVSGTAAAEHLAGYAGHDLLDGNGGRDTLYGGIGNDSFVVDSPDDVVVEMAGEGTDTVLAEVSYTLPDFVERLRIVTAGAADATGNALNNLITAGSGDNVLDGGDGMDTLSYAGHAGGVVVSLAAAGPQATQGSGSDTVLNFEHLSGSESSDTLTGNAAANTLNGLGGDDHLVGGAGRDRLIGGPGADVLEGGADNDTYEVDDSADTIVELAGEGFADLVIATVGYDLPEQVEQLRIATGAPVHGHGNALNNLIFAGTGDNHLDGGAGVDTLSYALHAAGVTVSLAQTGAQATGGSGDDTVLNFEKLVGSSFADSLAGDGNANALAGGAGDDQLAGDAGNDTLEGGVGADLLSGGAGLDHFVFNTTLADGNVDTITDFTAGSDRILIDDDVFTALAGRGMRTLAADKFLAGPGATEAAAASHRIVYDTTTGELRYDADGPGGTAAVCFAVLQLAGVPAAMAAGDISIVA